MGNMQYNVNVDERVTRRHADQLKPSSVNHEQGMTAGAISQLQDGVTSPADGQPSDIHGTQLMTVMSLHKFCHPQGPEVLSR